MRYVILGGGCSFAIHTALALLADKTTECVTAVGRHARPIMHELVGYPHDHRYPFVVCNIAETDQLIAMLDEWEPHVIINFAAEGESGASFTGPWKYFAINNVALVLLSERLLHKPYLRRFIQISSGEVYGSVETPAREGDLLNPTSPYAASKAAADHFLLAYHKRRGFPVNIVRPSNTYGEGQQLFRIIPKAIMFGLTGQKIPLYGSGHGEKSYLHAADLAQGILAVARSAPLGQIYNFAPRMPVTTREIVRLVAKEIGIPETSLFTDTALRRGTDARYWLDAQKAERELDWKPQMTLHMGIARMVRWHKERLSALKELLPGEIARQPVPQLIGV